MVCWRFPPSPKSTYALNPVVEESPFDAGEPVNKRARAGEPPTQFRPELVPFDYTDFKSIIAGAYATMQTSKTNRCAGIADLPFHEFNRRDGVNDAYTLLGEQEEAGGHKYGRIVGGLAMLEVLLQYGLVETTDAFDAVFAALTDVTKSAEDKNKEFAKLKKSATQAERIGHIRAAEQMASVIGLWNTDMTKQGILLDIFANMYFNDLYEDARVSGIKADFVAYCGGKDAARKVAFASNLANVHADNYQKARLLASKYTEGALVGNWFSKTSQIIGRSMNSCASGDTLHVLAGHFNL